jgi:hypothetical protein
MHHAICYAIYDLGTHYNERFGKSSHKVRVVWELPDERLNITKEDHEYNLPASISKEYTLSLHEKSTLRKDLESWRGKRFTDQELEGFDLTKLLGVNCTLQVIHNTKGEKIYANISTIVPIMKHMEKKDPENDLRYFSFEEHTQIPENTPEWITDMIKNSDEWKSLCDGQEYDERNPPPMDEDLIPF